MQLPCERAILCRQASMCSSDLARAPCETAMKGNRHLRKGWQRSSQGPQHEQRQRHHQQDDREKDQRFGIAHEPHGGGPTARGISPAASIYTIGLHHSQIDLRQFPPASSRSNDFRVQVPDAREWTASGDPSPLPGAVFDWLANSIGSDLSTCPRWRSA